MIAQIQLRRGTSTEWNTYNPVLAQAEIGMEYGDSYPLFKIGDGITNWKNLPYFSLDQLRDGEQFKKLTVEQYNTITQHALLVDGFHGINNPDTVTILNKLKLNHTDLTLDYPIGESGDTMQLGQEQFVIAFNSTGNTITKGSVVYLTGASNNRPTIALSIANSKDVVKATVGVATTDIPAGESGFVTTYGFLQNVPISDLEVGNEVFLSATTAGTYTKVRPAKPNYAFSVGYCISTSASFATLFIYPRVVPAVNFDELGQVFISNPQANNLLRYNGTNWVNIASGTGGGIDADLLDGQHGSYYTTAGNLTGTIPSAVLGNSSLYIGTTQVALNRASGNLSLAGISGITFANAAANNIQTTVSSAGTVGRALSIYAGSTSAGTANISGGDLSLYSGNSTGSGKSSIYFYVSPEGTAGQTTANGQLIAANITRSLAGTGKLGLIDTNASHYLYLQPGSDLSSDRSLTFTTGDFDRTVTLSGNLTVNNAMTIGGTTGTISLGSNTHSVTIATTGNTSITLPTSGTLAIIGNPLSQFASTTSSQLAGVISDETGSGALVFATSPSLTTPSLGVATATSINKVTITQPTTGSTLTIANGKTLTANSSLTLAGVDSKTLTINNSLTLAGTDSTTMTFPSSTDTVMGLGTAQTVTGTKTFNNSTINIKGSSTGYTTLTSANASTNNYTLTIPASTTTIVGTDVEQTLTNKTLTAPKITSASYIADSNGNELILFPAIVTSPVNEITISNAGTSANPSISASGNDLNIGLSLIPKGTGEVNVVGSLVVSSNLTVQGTTTFIDTSTLQVEDNNIELGKVTTPTNTTADGGGITLLAGTDVNKTISWDKTTTNWTSSEHWNLVTGKSYKINNVDVLNSTTLGSTVVSSSLTSVGTIGTGTWSATTIATNKGGTGLTSFTANGAVYATSTSALTTGTLPIASGGTGATSVTQYGVIYGSSTNAYASTAVGTTGQYLRATSSGAPAFATIANGEIPSALTGKTYNALSLTAQATGFTIAGGTTSKTLTVGADASVSGTNTGDVTLATNHGLSLTNQVIGMGTPSSITSSSTNSVSTTTHTHAITGEALTKTDDTNVTLTLGGTPATGLVKAISLTLGWTGQLAVGRGGTGASSFTAGRVLFGNGASAINTSANLFWDNSNNKLGVGTITPAEKIHSVGDIRIDDSAGNAGFKMTYDNTAKSLQFNFVGV